MSPSGTMSAPTKQRPPLTASKESDEVHVAQTIEGLRKRMETALAQQQTSPESTSSSGSTAQDPIALRRTLPERQVLPSGSSEVIGGTTSTDSMTTVKGEYNQTPDTVRTPSYPFPRMALRLPRGQSQLSGPRHKPFTLLSPTNVPDLPMGSSENLMSMARTPGTAQPSDSSAGDGPPPEDPNYPLPDLYDLILLLNAEPGLDAWWMNVTEILAEVYSAERASLAVPGDMTDLENVPWGQKASFSIHGIEMSDSSTIASEMTGALEQEIQSRRGDPSGLGIDSILQTSGGGRPTLETRHSIAGMLPDSILRSSMRKSFGPIRAISGRVEAPSRPREVTERPSLRQEITAGYSSESASQGTRAIVYNTLRALESESDPLIIRTGITGLFGKRKPIIMTRSYTDRSASQGNMKTGRDSRGDGATSRSNQSKPARPQPSRAAASSSKLVARSKSKMLHDYQEFEQPEPRPWSKSPHPSPAAVVESSDSPFFAQTANVDESAFDPGPASQEYSVDQPVEAIGMDCSKTLIHIPLIQPIPYRRPSPSNLTFPTAIISLLVPLTPYPLTLKYSLAGLLPHLASSYSMAMQFSTLESQALGRPTNRVSRGLGLGGTFSDESSELELAADLRGQIATGSEDSRSTIYGGQRSPSERSANIRASPYGTPSIELSSYGFTPSLSPTPGRGGVETADGYFSSKRPKSSHQAPRSPGAAGFSKTKQQGAEEAQRAKKQRPVLSSQPSGRTKASISRKQGPSNPSSPRLEHPPETSGAEGFRSDSISTEGGDPSASRHPSVASTMMPGDGNDRALPDSVSQLLLNSVPLQLFLAKPRTGELIWTNSKFDAFRTQTMPQEARSKDPWQNIHDSDRLSLAKAWKSVLKTGAQMTQHIRVKRFSNDSDYRWFIFRANPLLAHSGQLMYWIGSFLDVHDQHVAEKKSAEERDALLRKAKYQALANSIPQILFEAVENVGIVSANEQWHTFSGQPLEDALSLGFTKHVHRDDLEKCGIIIAATARTEDPGSVSGSSDSSQRTATQDRADCQSPADVLSLTSLVQKGILNIEQDENGRISYSTELRLRSRGGEFRWFLVRLVKVESDLLNGGRASWYGTCTDINDRRALERELNRVNQRMQQEMVSKTKFFANMSHEIRTPLNGILGSIPWLAESALQPDQRRTLDTIQNSSNSLRELVDNILDVTKVEAGKMTLNNKWFHVRTLLEEVIDTVASRAIEKGLEVNYTIDSGVPPSVKSDPFRLRQILINLMGNAIKFTNSGEVYTRCYVKAPREGQEDEPNYIDLAFEVTDTGKGFKESDVNQIFQQFGQIGHPSSHDAGSGLGLFLSKQLVELMGGQLDAKSQADEGSTFTFFLRVATRTEDMPDSPPVKRRASERSSITDPTLSTSTPGHEGVLSAINKGILRSPGRSGYVASPETQSPAMASSGSSNPSLHSFSATQTDRSSMSSIAASDLSRTKTTERHDMVERALEASTALRRSSPKEDESRSFVRSNSSLHPTTYSIVVVCPAQYARTAIKQHIGQVIPHQIAANITTLNDSQDFFDLVNGESPSVFTHVVLDLPDADDVMLVMRKMLKFNASITPTLVIITDHYQKRDIAEDHAALTKAGRIAYMVHKPAKPSVFALIFDPAQQRFLSIDRNRGMAQSVTEDFKNVADRVRNTLGGKGHRIMLVEDSDVNRLVILRYLKKVELLSETATNGQECLDLFMSKQPGYYSLIICDIQMPVKNGYEACRELREWEASHNLASTPMMALTANAMPEERAAAAQVGFTDYLTKPVEFNKLGSMMVRLLDPKTEISC